MITTIIMRRDGGERWTDGIGWERMGTECDEIRKRGAMFVLLIIVVIQRQD